MTIEELIPGQMMQLTPDSQPEIIKWLGSSFHALAVCGERYPKIQFYNGEEKLVTAKQEDWILRPMTNQGNYLFTDQEVKDYFERHPYITHININNDDNNGEIITP